MGTWLPSGRQLEVSLGAPVPQAGSGSGIPGLRAIAFLLPAAAGLEQLCLGGCLPESLSTDGEKAELQAWVFHPLLISVYVSE